MKRALNKRLQTIGKKIKKEYRVEKVILFGSYAKGNASEDSDVDLLVIAPTKERFFERMASVGRLIRDLRDGLPVSPIVLTPGELEKRRAAGDPFVREFWRQEFLYEQRLGCVRRRRVVADRPQRLEARRKEP